MRTFDCRSDTCGFTFPELLLVIAVLAIVAALSVASIGSVTERRDQVHCLTNLRQIGIGISVYQNDHDGLFPGPLNIGQGVFFDQNELPSKLAPLMGFPVGSASQMVPTVFICPAWLKAVEAPKPKGSAVCYVVNHQIWLAGVRYEPFGYPAKGTGSTETPPLTRSRMTAAEGKPYTQANPPDSTFRLSTTWMIEDLDAQVTGISASWWLPFKIPSKPVHGKTRNVLYFDFHAAGAGV